MPLLFIFIWLGVVFSVHEPSHREPNKTVTTMDVMKNCMDLCQSLCDHLSKTNVSALERQQWKTNEQFVHIGEVC